MADHTVEDRSAYAKVVIREVPRLIGLLDRNALSPTYGSFDRTYWHYKTVDFACSRLQEAALSLAILYSTPFKGNPYHGQKKILDWSIAAMHFWTTLQNRSGAFSEWYPNEWSFVATAFSTYAISEAYKITSHKIPSPTKNLVAESLRKAASWLLRRDERMALNQEAGAAMALYNVYELFKDEDYKNGAQTKALIVIQNQSDEGWYPEYGGADLGYLSLTIDYLAKYYRMTGDEQLLKSLNRAVKFVSYFIHPDGTFGGEYGSRNTEFIMPHGFEILSSKIPLARFIADFVAHSLTQGLGVTPHALDNRYLCYILYDYLQACLERTYSTSQAFPSRKQKFTCQSKPFRKYFPHARLYVVRTPSYYMVFGAGKGGVIKVFRVKGEGSAHLVFSDCGFWGTLSEGSIISTQWQDPKFRVEVEENGKVVKVTGSFHKINYRLPTPASNIVFRAVLSTVGKNEGVARFLKEVFRKKLITKSPTVPVHFSRTLRSEDSEVIVTDSLQVGDKLSIKSLDAGDFFILIYVPSTQYFGLHHLIKTIPPTPKNLADRLNSQRKITFKRKILPEQEVVTLEEVKTEEV